MNVGIYNNRTAWNEVGGIAVFNRRIGVELAEAGHEVTFYSSMAGERHPELDRPNVTVVRIDQRRPARLLRALTLGQLHPHVVECVSFGVASVLSGVHRRIERREDVVLTSTLFEDLILSRAVETPIVHEYHTNLRSVGIGTRMGKHGSDTRVNLANSQTTADQLKAELDIDVDGIVRPGVDTDEFSVSPSDSPTPPQITFVGRLHDDKGVTELLHAFDRLDADARLNIVGTGPHENRFKRLARELGTDGVRFHGKVPQSELPGYFHRATLACHPSRHDSFCIANIEAMSTATPVVTTDLPAISEYATDGENCRLVPTEDAETLRNVVDELLSSPAQRRALAEGGRATAERFNWGNQAADMLGYCEEAIRRSRTGA